MAKRLFEGLRIVDITIYVTGPITTRHFADLGAEVIKIETRSRIPPGMAAIRVSPHDNSKLSITLDFSSPQGLDLVKQIIAKSDIVVENRAGGSLKRRGLGYEDLKKIKPDIIMLSTCMQGQTGPHASHAASGHKLTALSGFNHIFGWPDRPPAWIAAYTDMVAPRYNILAILAALDYRRRTGKGQYLDMSQNEGGIQFMAPILLDYTVNQRVADRMGNRYPNSSPHNVYRCLGEDRWCAIAVFTDEEWRSFCKIIGNPTLSEDPRFATLLARKDNEEELDQLTNEWTVKHSAEEVMTLMQTAGVAAGVAETAKDQLDHDPQLKHRHFFREVEHPQVGTQISPVGPHFQLSKTACELRRAPILGEHNDYVFKELLGISDEEVTRLVNEGVIN